MLDDFQDDEPNNNSEFLDEFRQRLNSQPLENLEERKNEINRSQHIFLGSVLGIGLAGIVSWFILSPDYDNSKNADIPVIRRPHSETKIQPADPGGMEILNQDKTVYDIVEKNDNPEIKVENLLPPPEEPKLPSVNKPTESTADIALNENNDIIKNAEKIIEEETSKAAKIEQAATNSLPSNNATTSQEVKKAEASVPEEIKPEEKNVEIKKAETSKIETPKVETPKVAASSQAVPSGRWQIQLISSPNKAAMEKAWVDLTKKHTALKGLPHEIESADLGTKGTFYRLKAGAFQTRTDADKLCNSIKNAGGSCLVKKKQ